MKTKGRMFTKNVVGALSVSLCHPLSGNMYILVMVGCFASHLKKSKGKKKMSFNPKLHSTLSLGTFKELNKAQRMVLDPSCEGGWGYVFP